VFIIVVLIIIVLLGILYYLFVVKTALPNLAVIGSSTGTTPNSGTVNEAIASRTGGLISVTNSSVQTSTITSGTDTIHTGGNVIYNAAPTTGDITLRVPANSNNSFGTVIRINNTAPLTSKFVIRVLPVTNETTITPEGVQVVAATRHLTLIATGLNTYRAIPDVDPVLYVFDQDSSDLREFLALYSLTETAFRYIVRRTIDRSYAVVSRTYLPTNPGQPAEFFETSSNAITILPRVYIFSLNGQTFTQGENSATAIPAPPSQTIARPLLGGFIPGIVGIISPLIPPVVNGLKEIPRKIDQAIKSVEESLQSVTNTVKELGDSVAATAKSVGAFFPRALNALNSFSQSAISTIGTAFKVVGIILIVLLVVIAIWFIFKIFGAAFSLFSNYRIATSSKL